ncbi:MAG: RNA-binding protein [bacterium]|nr:RNA-binding protein [bacterium]
MSENKIYVGNLPFRISKESLEEHFAQFGSVAETIIISDRETGRSRGFGFVSFETEDGMNTAIKADGSELDGRPLKINQAQARN